MAKATILSVRAQRRARASPGYGPARLGAALSRRRARPGPQRSRSSRAGPSRSGPGPVPGHTGSDPPKPSRCQPRADPQPQRDAATPPIVLLLQTPSPATNLQQKLRLQRVFPHAAVTRQLVPDPSDSPRLSRCQPGPDKGQQPFRGPAGRCGAPGPAHGERAAPLPPPGAGKLRRLSPGGGSGSSGTQTAPGRPARAWHRDSRR